MAARAGLQSPLLARTESTCSASSPSDWWARAWEDVDTVNCTDGIDKAWLAQFPLQTKGRYIINRQGFRFRLKGVNWYGASDVMHVVGGLDTQRLDEICMSVRDLGFNVVRLPFSNEMLRCDVPDAAIDYTLNPDLKGLSALEVYDAVVHCLGLHEVAVIVNNHTTYGEFCGPPSKNSLWFDPSSTFTEEQWLNDWRMMARRYSRCPHVVGHDLRNELRPRGVMWPAWRSASNPEQLRGRCNWARVARQAAKTVLAESPDALVVVERIVWPQRALKDYAACPGPLLPEFQGRLVLGAHLYQWSGPGRFIPNWSVPPRWKWILKVLRVFGIVASHNYGDMHPERFRAQMAEELGAVLEAGACPVWISEFGADLSNKEEMRWLKDFVEIAAEHEADWAYWPLNVGPKPECGSDEAYGMLASNWKPKQEGDRRLEILEKLGLTRPEGVPEPDKAMSPKARPRTNTNGSSSRARFSNKDPLRSLLSKPANLREIAEIVHLPVGRFSLAQPGGLMKRRATVPHKLSSYGQEESSQKTDGNMRRVTTHSGMLSPAAAGPQRF